MYKAFSAYASSGQVVTANNLINFIKDYDKPCNGISLENGNTIEIVCPGVYFVSCMVTLTATAAGTFTIQLLNNGTAIPGALASTTVAEGSVYTLPISKLIRVNNSCPVVNSQANLTVQVTSGSGTITNANISVIQ